MLLRKAVRPTMTQAELADAIGVTQQAVSNWMSGRAKPGRAHASKIQRILGIPTDSWEQAGPDENGDEDDEPATGTDG